MAENRSASLVWRVVVVLAVLLMALWLMVFALFRRVDALTDLSRTNRENLICPLVEAQADRIPPRDLTKARALCDRP